MSTSSTVRPAADPAAPAHRARHPALALAVILVCQLMVIVDVSVVTVALPDIRTGLHLSATGLSWVQNAYTLAFGGLLLLGGRAGDILGRRRVLLAGVVLFTLASLLGGLAASAGWLLAARAAQGAGAALAAPSVLALIATNFEGRERTRALGFFSAVSGGGASLGLVGGGMLTEWLSWRGVMFVNVPIGLAVVLLAPRLIREPPRHPGRLDLAGAFTATTGLVSLVYGFVRAAEKGGGDPVTWGALGAAAVLLGAFVLVERRAGQPLVPLRLLTDRVRGPAYAVVLLFASGMFAMFYFLTLFLQDVLGYGPLGAGLAFLPLTVLLFVMARTAPRLVHRFGTRPLILTGLTLLACGLAWLTRIPEATGYGSGIVGPLLLLGIGAGLSVMPLTVTILAGVPPQDSGAASGVLQTMQQAGGSLGLAVLVTVFTAANADAAPQDVPAHGMGAAFTVATGLLATALLVALVMLRPSRSAGSGD